MKRAAVGAILFLVLVGEPTVGKSTGLFTPPGLLVLCLLYVTYFLLLDSLVLFRRLSNLRVTLINFALYSVLITGLLHGELRDYVLHPHNSLITTLIRIQCSLYPLFAYVLLNKVAPATRPVLSAPKSFTLFIGSMLLLSASGQFGVADIAHTFRDAPLIAVCFTVIGLIALTTSLIAASKPTQPYHSRILLGWSILLFLLGLIPGKATFITLILVMIGIGAYYLIKPSFRRASP